MNDLPYSGATSGLKARGEISRILERFGCERVGFMDEFDTKSVLLAFTHKGRNVQLRASGAGWANAYVRANPWTHKRRYTREEWYDRALTQGMIAVSSILRDWVKGQMTAVETGILEFDHIFLPYMLGSDGQPLAVQMQAQLPRLTDGR